MLFCERCHLPTDEKKCPNCNNKKLREIDDNDFCFFVNLSAPYFEMFAETLKNNGIEAVGVPYYPQNAVVFSNAGRAEGRRVYIKYKDVDFAREIYSELFDLNE